jgi:hypothetical protein
MTCDYCKRILYYVPPPPKPEGENIAVEPVAPEAVPSSDDVAQ